MLKESKAFRVVGHQCVSCPHCLLSSAALNRDPFGIPSAMNMDARHDDKKALYGRTAIDAIRIGLES